MGVGVAPWHRPWASSILPEEEAQIVSDTITEVSRTGPAERQPLCVQPRRLQHCPNIPSSTSPAPAPGLLGREATGGLGAQVIKIELPGSDDTPDFMDRHSPDFQNLHRNKRSMTLNLKHPDGLAIFAAGAPGRCDCRELPPRREAPPALITRRSRRSIRASSMAAFPASARMGRMWTVLALIPSCKGWAAI